MVSSEIIKNVLTEIIRKLIFLFPLFAIYQKFCKNIVLDLMYKALRITKCPKSFCLEYLYLKYQKNINLTDVHFIKSKIETSLN